MQQLPTELIDFIIDFLHSDKRALARCSLVCRNWLPASRFHLFGTVIVSPSNVRTFVKLLAHPSSTIANHVHKLRIFLQSIFEAVVVPVFDIIAPYLEQFVAVESIALYGRPWQPIKEEGLSRGFRSGRIGNMDLTGVYYNFSISWYRLTFTLGDNGPSTFLSRLHIFGTCSDGRSPWLPAIAQCPAVSRFDFFGIQENHLSTVRAMLESGGQSILAIDLGFSVVQSNIVAIADSVDLSHNTSLRSLSILDLDLRKSNEIQVRGFFSKLIERISSVYLTHIRIGVSVKDWVNLSWLDCKKVADELNHPRFSELQKLRIDIMGVPGEEEAIAWVRTEMASLDSRGVLAVTFI